MDSQGFKNFRAKLKKTQKQMAALLAISLKTVCSYEQGTRSIPMHVERQILFLVSRLQVKRTGKQICWDQMHCPEELRKNCPAWEFQVGDLCWLINGTICRGGAQKNWREKMKICRSCKVFADLFRPG